VDKFIASRSREIGRENRQTFKIDMAKLNVGDIIEVHGFTMLEE
jgi:hypothetical protein